MTAQPPRLLSHALMVRTPAMLLCTAVGTLGFIALEPQQWDAMVAFLGAFAVAAVSTPPHNPKYGTWVEVLLRLLTRIGPVLSSWYILSYRLNHPASDGLFAISLGYFWFRLVELQNEPPDSPFFAPGSKCLRIAYVYWFLDVRTLKVLPDRAPTLPIVLSVAGFFGASQLCGAIAMNPSLPMGLRVYGMLGSFVLGLLGVDAFYRLAVQLIFSGQVSIASSMMEPWNAVGVRDFWGRRWNRVIGGSLTKLVFKPLVPVIGPSGATMATFFASGFYHTWPMYVAGLSLDACFMMMGFFALHGLLVGAEQHGLYAPGRLVTLLILGATWPLFGRQLIALAAPDLELAAVPA